MTHDLRPLVLLISVTLFVLASADVLGNDDPLLSQKLPSLGLHFAVSELSIEVPRTDLATDAADVYAPAVRPRMRHRFTNAFPLVAVLQGAMVDKSQYAAFGRRLASQGFVVVVPNHLRSLTLPGASEPVLAPFTEVNVVNHVLERIAAEDANPKSSLHRIVDTNRMALVGHSLGGSVGLYAIAERCAPAICSTYRGSLDEGYRRPAALKAAALYGTNLVNADSTVTDLDSSGVAVALVEGSRDGVATLQEAEETFPTLESPRALISVEGANHYGICDENNPAGAVADESLPELDQDEAVDYIATWTGLWLREQLTRDLIARFWIERVSGSLDGVVQVLVE
jgi:dienelactone hydrolase